MGTDLTDAALFPILQNITAADPRIRSVAFSSVRDGEGIRWHRGYYLGVLRMMYTLQLDDECRDHQAIHVMAVTHDWPFGKPGEPVPASTQQAERRRLPFIERQGFIFNDNFFHTVANTCMGRRVAVYLDVLNHELPWLLAAVDWCLMSLVAMYNPFADYIAEWQTGAYSSGT